MKPLELEKKLEKYLDSFVNELLNSGTQIKLPSLNNIKITEAILYRMRAYYHQQEALKRILDKHKIAPAADFFVETVTFYLKIYFAQNNPSYQVHSELGVKRKRGALHPDITIWKNDQVIAAIECKTQLGWNRHGWRDQHFDRKKKLRADFPNSKTFLISMTDVNWEGFAQDPLVGKEFYTLSKIHPGAILKGHEASAIMNPIENLIEQI